MVENKYSFNEKEYEKGKQKLQLCLMGLCLLILFQIFLFCYGEKKEYSSNIKELEFLCEVYPGYFLLLDSDTKLAIYMDNIGYDRDTFEKNAKIAPKDRENYTSYYIKVDNNGELIFTESDIENGVKSFYTESLYRAYKETFKYRSE